MDPMSPMTEPLVSVIVLGWGGEHYIETCLNALLRQTYATPEVIVVDNASPDRTAEIVERQFPEVRLIRTQCNLGVAGGNNLGLRAAQGDILVLVNADVEATPTWLEQMIRAMQSNSRIGIAGAKLLYPDGTIQFAGGRIEGPQGYARHIGWHERDQGQWDSLSDVDFVTGASLAITRTALEQIGYEDERFFPIDYEDPDLSYRARAAGYRVILVPTAVATHRESSTTGAASRDRMLSLEAGRVRFVCKHWATHRLREEFFPAEYQFLEQGPPERRQVMRWVYLKMLREIDDLADWRDRLGVASCAESAAVLTEMLTALRGACLPKAGALQSDKRVSQILSTWFASDSSAAKTNSEALFLALGSMNGQVESHPPVAWPRWPPGLWPKIIALYKKSTRWLLAWYINPIVEQQNAINAILLQALETLAQDVMLFQDLETGDYASSPDDPKD
jgi:GT2 family glycosyltransferase